MSGRFQLTYFYRKVNPLFFSIEKVFGGISSQLKGDPSVDLDIREERVPFYSSPKNIRGNMQFLSGKQSSINHITGDIHYGILSFRKSNINVLTIHDCVSLGFNKQKGLKYWMIKWLWYT